MEIEVVPNGEICHYNYNLQGKEKRVQIACDCGGKSQVFVIDCSRPGSFHELRGYCMKCQKSLSTTIHLFFA